MNVSFLIHVILSYKYNFNYDIHFDDGPCLCFFNVSDKR